MLYSYFDIFAPTRIFFFNSITFHEDAIHCAVGTDDGRILFYDWRNVRKPIVAIESSTSHPVHALAFQVYS